MLIQDDKQKKKILPSFSICLGNYNLNYNITANHVFYLFLHICLYKIMVHFLEGRNACDKYEVPSSQEFLNIAPLLCVLL